MTWYLINNKNIFLLAVSNLSVNVSCCVVILFHSLELLKGDGLLPVWAGVCLSGSFPQFTIEANKKAHKHRGPIQRSGLQLYRQTAHLPLISAKAPNTSLHLGKITLSMSEKIPLSTPPQSGLSRPPALVKPTTWYESTMLKLSNSLSGGFM